MDVKTTTTMMHGNKNKEKNLDELLLCGISLQIDSASELFKYWSDF